MPRRKIRDRANLTRDDYLKLIQDVSQKDNLVLPPRKKRQSPRLRKMRGGGGGNNKLFKKNLYLYGLIGQNSNKAQRRALIDSMNQSQMRGVQHLISDFLKKKYEVPTKILKKLRRDRRYIYDLLNNDLPIENHKEILKQRGGFISSLIPLAGALASPMLDLLFKAVG